MDVLVEGQVKGLAKPLAPQSITLSPSEAKVASWEITVPMGVRTLQYDVQAKAEEITDRVRVTQQVQPAVPVRTFQATLMQWDQAMRLPVERPAASLPGRGGVRSPSASLTDGLGAREWMSAVHLLGRGLRVVACAITSAGGASCEPALVPGLGWPPQVFSQDGRERGLDGVCPGCCPRVGMGAPGRGSKEDGEGTPAVRGGRYPPTVRFAYGRPLDPARRLEALSRHRKAGAETALGVTIEPISWPTSAVLDWWNILHRVPGSPIGRRDWVRPNRSSAHG
jgi:hypothetical protein